MSINTTEINSVKITFDKEKTKAYRNSFNSHCDCQDCRNFYKNLEDNNELIEFLNIFGIDYQCSDEIFSWELGEESNSFIHYEGYYGVYGYFDGDDFNYENFGIKITFSKGASVPHNRTGEYFWVCVDGDFPYMLDEERELTVTFSQKIERLSFFDKLKSILRLI